MKNANQCLFFSEVFKNFTFKTSVIVILIYSLFVSKAVAQIADGNYQIMLGNALVLDADIGHISENDCKVQLWSNNGAQYASQTWTITSIGNNLYDIILTASGKALDADGACINANGCKLRLWDRNKGKTQRWRIAPTSDSRYTIVLAETGKALDAYQPDMNKRGCKIELWDFNTDCRSCESKKWWILPALTAPLPPVSTPRKRPNQADSNIGYSPLNIDLGDGTPGYLPDFLVDFDLGGGLEVKNAKADIDKICPQHRSVGEQSALPIPRKSYEVLQGIVVPRGAGVAFQDFPSSHYTHDFSFKVIPDPEYDYLLGANYHTEYSRSCEELSIKIKKKEGELAYAISANKPQTRINLLEKQLADLDKQFARCGEIEVADNYQKEIEVEWESGLAQDAASDNPAVSDNIVGNSFGFFSAGHTLKDVIWNWPTVNDRVYVEGIWIWDRGHNAATEIHPPHFLAVQRKLPVSLIVDANGTPIIRNQADDKFIATRVDVFASADGSIMWNTKGLKPYAQVIDMNRKDYTFTIKHPFKRVSLNTTLHNIQLRCKFIKQKGDNFPVAPIITIKTNGEVQVTVPWKTNNVSNTAIFARTFVVYWEDVPVIAATTKTIKVLEQEKPKLFQVEIIKVDLLKKINGSNNDEEEQGYGNCRIFCNVGSDWIFLNEFDPTINISNILNSGLSNALSNNSFAINKTFNLYVQNIVFDPTAYFRMAAHGWEADGVNLLVGHIFNSYSRDSENLAYYFGSKLPLLKNNDKGDDEIGSFDTTFNSTYALNNIQILPAIDNKGTVFNIFYRITNIPYSSIVDNNSGNR